MLIYLQGLSAFKGHMTKFFFKCLMIKMGPHVSFSLTNFRKASPDYRPLTSYFLEQLL